MKNNIVTRDDNSIYISGRPLSEYELMKLFNDYIPMSPADNNILISEEYEWKKEHGFAERDYTHYPRRKSK